MEVEGIDIVFALDISDSMLIYDMGESDRLEAAKDTISEFIRQRVTDRIGLIVFYRRSLHSGSADFGLSFVARKPKLGDHNKKASARNSHWCGYGQCGCSP